MPRISVVTPTYNRAHLLPRLFGSLKAQTFLDFEWIIVDDGSTDDTARVVAGFQREAPFPVRYLKQENRGMQSAWNRGVAEAGGEFCAVIGSDDWYVDAALETLLRHWEGIPERDRPSFANIEGLAITPSGTVIGDRFPSDVFDSDNFAQVYEHCIRGDKVGMYRTEVAQRYPFPDWRSGSEAIAWYRVARDFRSRFINEPIAVVDYQREGLSRRDPLARVADPEPWHLLHRETLEMRRRLRSADALGIASNYVRFALRARRLPRWSVLSNVPARLALVAVPIGMALAARDSVRLALRALTR